MYEQVIFYNHFGAGDVYESREFVKAWIGLVPAKRYCYSHGKHPRILLDLPEIEFKEITVHMKPTISVWDDLNGNLYVNTWIGRDGKYVLPGIGCTVEKLYEMHNDMLRVYDLGKLPDNPIDYIPDLNFSVFEIANINQFMQERQEEKIFIDNGLVQSKQAENFPFNPIIDTVARNYPEKLFIVTHSYQATSPNVVTTSEIIGKNLGFDLTEVAYISLFCSTLIGRNSGPHVHTQNCMNCSDPAKKLLSFTYQQQGSSFVVNTPVQIRKFWSPATRNNNVIQEIERILNE